MDKIEYKRMKYVYQGRTIYEWEQSLEEIQVYIDVPPGVTAKMISCDIAPNKLTLGLKGNPPFMAEEFCEMVRQDESFWTLDGGVINISLTKASKGQTWMSLMKNHTDVDPHTQSEMQKSMMLERFQAENPGFDFSGAQFNGNVPDPKNFMGGVGYNN